MTFNRRGVWAIYRFELARFGRTILTSLITPAITTSLYFIVFGAAIGSRMTEVGGVPYGAFIVPGLMLLSMLLGRSIGLDRQMLLDLGIGALMHDVGKLELPASAHHFHEHLTADELRAYLDHVPLGVALARRMGRDADRPDAVKPGEWGQGSFPRWAFGYRLAENKVESLDLPGPVGAGRRALRGLAAGDTSYLSQGF